MALGVLAALLALSSACAGSNSPNASGQAGTVPTIADARFGETSPLTLVVTNQSFEQPSIGLTVIVDGAVAVTGKFDVESQHNFRYYSFDMPAGSHEIKIDGGAKHATATIEVVGRAQSRWLVISYWEDQIRTETFNTRPLFG